MGLVSLNFATIPPSVLTYLAVTAAILLLRRWLHKTQERQLILSRLVLSLLFNHARFDG